MGFSDRKVIIFQVYRWPGGKISLPKESVVKFGMFLVLTLSLVSCRPDQEDSNFNELNGIEITQEDFEQEVD